MQDILPEDVPLWKKIESAMHRICALYRYSEIRTPLFEFTSLYKRSVGEVTDIVEKEMYTFTSNTESTPISLRPEFTAGIVRAYLQHNMHKQKAFQKFYAFGPLFRRERPQKGRYRQFHQFDIEALGSPSPYLDAETILLASDFLNELGLKEYKISINSIGCPTCRAVYREVLKNALIPNKDGLCQNCQSRYDRNVFRIMDCKSEKCRAIAAGLPSIQGSLGAQGSLCPGCKTHFDKFRGALDSAGVQYAINPQLVRGFDYYTRTIYEFTYPSALGAQDAILGGGRYDNLIEELGGPKLGAVGFAAGIERIILAMKNETMIERVVEKHIQKQKQNVLFELAISDNERKNAFEKAMFWRREGIPADVDYENRSFKAQKKIADKADIGFSDTTGPDEIKTNEHRIKSMKSGKEIVFKLYDLNIEQQKILKIHDKGVRAHKEGNEPEAIKYYETAEMKLNDFFDKSFENALIFSRFYLNMGISYRNVGKYEKAEEYVKKAVESDRNYALALFVQSSVYEKLNKRKEAINAFMEAYELNTNTLSWAQSEGNKEYFPQEFLDRLKSEVEKQYVYDASGTQNVKNPMSK